MNAHTVTVTFDDEKLGAVKSEKKMDGVSRPNP
jgi:hypothetical protein